MSAAAPAVAASSPERDLLDHIGVVLALVPGMLLFGLTSTLLDIPRILVVSEMGSDRYRVQWVVGAALLGGVIGISCIAWLIERLGLRACYQLGLLIYLIGGFASSQTIGTDALMPARFIQSWGGSMIIATSLIILWREFPRHRDLGVIVFAFGIYFGRMVGPSISGWLVNHDSWRSVFYATTAIAFAAFAISWWALQPDEPAHPSSAPFDFLGLALLAGWVICLATGLYRFQLWGWRRSNETELAAAAGLGLFALFIWRQLAAAHPLLDLRLLFTRHHFGLSVAVKSLFDAQFVAVLAILTRYLVITRDYPRPTASHVFLPAVGATVATLAATACFGTRGNRKLRLLLGLAAMVLAEWQLTRVDLFTEKEWVSAILALWGCGVALVSAPIICISQDNLVQSEMVRTLSIKNLGLFLPGLIGGAGIDIAAERAGDAYFDVLRQTLQPNRIPVDDVTAGLSDYISSTHGSDPGSASTQASQVLGRYVRDTASVYSFQTAFGWLSLVGLAAIALSLLFRKLPHDAPGPLRG